MHISIIHDVRTIFSKMGHSVKSDNLSNHTWVNGEETSTNKVINQKNFRDIDERTCERFYKKYRRELDGYDAFVHSYPPVFALLFERFEKPIITIACTRFDFPVQKQNFDWYASRLREMKLNGQLLPVANNLLDKKICEIELGFEWEHISSLCNYLPTRYQPKTDELLLWTRSRVTPEDIGPSMEANFSIGERYDRESISKFAGVVHIPYNLSIMSAFEQYFQNIPMLFPTIRLQQEWYENRGDMLTEVLFPNSQLTFDPDWISLADWYDESNFSDVIYFDSLNAIESVIETTDFNEVSSRMYRQNELREKKIMEQWEELVRRIL
jgi:hypothetical protein